MMRATLQRLRRMFSTVDELDQAAAERAKEEEGERIERLARDPFAFPDREDWLAFRRRHGYRTRGL